MSALKTAQIGNFQFQHFSGLKNLSLVAWTFFMRYIRSEKCCLSACVNPSLFEKSKTIGKFLSSGSPDRPTFSKKESKLRLPVRSARNKETKRNEEKGQGESQRLFLSLPLFFMYFDRALLLSLATSH